MTVKELSQLYYLNREAVTANFESLKHFRGNIHGNPELMKGGITNDERRSDLSA